MAGNVWFSILPVNKDAKAIFDDVRNQQHVVITDGAGAPAINIVQVVFRDGLKPYCILSFGRSLDSDIKCDPPGIAIGRRMSQRQCSFSFHNRGLIFRDHSELHTSSISPEHLDSPDKWDMNQIPRQRAILEYGDWLISMGTATFRLRFRKNERWWERDSGDRDALARKIIPNAFALTDPSPSLPAIHETRTQIPVVPVKKIRPPIVFHELERLGKGAIGSVSRVMDLQSGRILAVKIIPVKEGGIEKDLKDRAKKEVEIIANLCHAHIVDFVHSQGWEMERPVQIFMPVADGSLRDIPRTNMEKKDVARVSRHIMAAIEYLHRKRFVHGDIKPENILYENRTTGFHFLLADFRFLTRIDSKTSCLGTQIYFAPEVWNAAQQDYRLDIWSLGVVMYEITKKINFTRRSGLTDRILEPKDWCNRLGYVCHNGGDLARMVTLEINKRATAKELNASPSFPNIPDDLPCVFDLPEIG